MPVVCTGFAQGSKKIKAAEPFSDVQGGSMCSILSIDATYFFMLLNLIKGNPSVVGYFPAVDIKVHDAGENRLRRSSSGGDCNVYGSQDADNHQDSRERSSVVPEVTPTRSGAHATHPEVLRTLG